MGVACNEDKPINSGGDSGKDNPPPETVTEINGTKIDATMNAVGLVADATTGKGIPGVPVTDGYNYVVTDANGVYQMKANMYTRKIYLSLPAGYQVPLDGQTHRPTFFSTTAFDYKNMNRNDFTLVKDATLSDDFTLVMIGDPQCQYQKYVDRYVQETVPDIAKYVANEKDVYCVTLGDIIFDSSDLWDEMAASMSNVKLASGRYLPFFQCIGNHDHDAKQSNDYKATANYVNHFGPTDYSFNRGKAHIIVMDDVVCTASKSNSSPNGCTWNYNAGFSEAQYKWLKQDIENVKDRENMVVMLCCHIPFRAGASTGGSSVNSDKKYDEVLSLLTQFKEAHLMIGHTHYNQNYIHKGYVCKGGQPIYEHVHGAACGAWWSCNSNVYGAPNGYSVYKVEGAGITDWKLKGTGRDEAYQMRVYDGNQTYSGTKGYVYNWYNASNYGGSSSIKAIGNASFKGAFVADIFGDDDSNWKVEMYQNGVKIGDFQRIPNGGSCNVMAAAYFFNELGKNTDTWTNKTASHYWYYRPASGMPATETNWEVRATHLIPYPSPEAGVTHTYSCSSLTTDYSVF